MPESQKPSVQSARWKLSEAALLAVVPAYGFYLAFRYEIGFANYYGYPHSFVIVSLESVFVAYASMLTFAILLFMIVNLIYLVISEEKQKNLTYFVPLIMSALLIFSEFYLKRPNLKEFFIFFSLLLFLCLIIYLPPLFSMKKHGSYFASLKASEDVEEISKGRSIFGKISLRVGYHSFMALIILIFFMPGLASSVGYRDARLKSSYVVFEKGEEFVVLNTYGQTMISATFNRKEKTFDRTFFLRPLIANPEIAFSAERVGPLKPKD